MHKSRVLWPTRTDRRQELVSRLFDVVAKNQTAIEETLNYLLKIIT
ncbi:MAG: hypothetical protein HYV66_00200 [Candidatus Sungbacteria bacterium]|uniref:Uncharacterized protein n=1 Tax=Candidatus Sungiibacteriota bacterium TaxID=2750080 RepID=A0A932DS00_9BACT|nr:hypothetical protein [Candidatus Sungbacteria bacterium]